LRIAKFLIFTSFIPRWNFYAYSFLGLSRPRLQRLNTMQSKPTSKFLQRRHPTTILIEQFFANIS